MLVDAAGGLIVQDGHLVCSALQVLCTSIGCSAPPMTARAVQRGTQHDSAAGYIHEYVHKYVYIYMHNYVHTCIYIYIYIYTCLISTIYVLCIYSVSTVYVCVYIYIYIHIVSLSIDVSLHPSGREMEIENDRAPG
jgi:hypothetical protein